MAPSPGVRLPGVELSDLHGRRTALADLWSEKGMPALIAIGHSDCGTTRLLLPYLDRIHRGRGPEGLVLCVLQDEPEAARALQEELSLELPVYLEADPYPLAQALDLTTVPTLLRVGPAGDVLAVSEGFRRDAVEAFAASAGHALPFFTEADTAPPLRPG
jgi:hypothetical protein